MNFNDIIKAIGIEPYYRDWQSDIVIYNADCRDYTNNTNYDILIMR